MNMWSRDLSTGVYALKTEPRITVARYCECKRSSCHFRWAVYIDRGLGPETVDEAPSLREAQDLALTSYIADMLTEVAS